MRGKIAIIGFLFFSAIACGNENTSISKEKGSEESQETRQESKAEILVNELIENHGGSKYDSAHFSFVFRDIEYSFHNKSSSFEYSRRFRKDSLEILDWMDGNNFSRLQNGSEMKLSAQEIGRYRSSINSVIYFATLPHKLNDEAVFKEYLGEDTIRGIAYQLVKVTFSEKGGGEDFDDEFLYWINSKNKNLDYFAYNYKVEGGGTRFRESINRRIVDGIVFQDYINYKAPIGMELKYLSKLFEKGELKLLSRIEMENIKALP